MPNQPFYPSQEARQLLWFSNLQGKIAGYSSTLEISPARQAKIALVLAWLIWTWQSYMGACRTLGPAATAWRDQLATGRSDAAADTAPPLPPVLTPPAGTPFFGMLSWLFEEIGRWRNAEGCTDAIGKDLGIIGSAAGGVDFATLKPKLILKLSGGQVEIPWGWGGFAREIDAIEILVDRGDGRGFVPLVIDTTPGYTDSAPPPAAPARWTYKAIYRIGEQRAGQWSDEASITVGG